VVKLKFSFYHSKFKNQLFFTEIFKTQGAATAPLPPPSDSRAWICYQNALCPWFLKNILLSLSIFCVLENYWIIFKLFIFEAISQSLLKGWMTVWTSAEIVLEEGNVDIFLSFSGCWRWNANGRPQNALLFLHHKENAPWKHALHLHLFWNF